MRGIAIATVLAALLSALPSARALENSVCCACVPTGESVPMPIPAFFCAPGAQQNRTRLVERCVSISDRNKLFCQANDLNSTCVEQLAGDGVSCPTAAAPASTPLNLGALAVVLGALGTFVLRRRRQPR